MARFEKSSGDFPENGIVTTSQPYSDPMPTIPSAGFSSIRRRSLNQVTVTASLIAVAFGTISWTAIEMLSGQHPSLRELVVHHAIPAVVIGLIIAVVLSVLLNRFVVDPIQTLLSHLYRIGSGRFDPLELDTSVEEVQALVDGVNLLARRLQAASGDASFAQVQERLQTLRKELRSMADAGGEEGELFLNIAKEMRSLEADLLAIGGQARPA